MLRTPPFAMIVCRVGTARSGEAQIAALVADYHENYAWLSVVAFARDVYGASAAVIEFPAPQSGKTDYYYGSIGELGPAAYDAEGEQLEPDLSTTWWRRVAATRERDDDLEDDRTWRARQIREYFTVLSQPSVEEMSIDYEQWIEEYVPDRRVRTDRPPRRGIETLYVRAADHADPAATFRQYPLPADPGDYETLTTDFDSNR